MFRSIVLAVCSFALVTFAQGAESAGDDASASPSAQQAVQFDGQTLLLASQGESEGTTIREFIPAGEELDHWSVLAAIRVFPNMDNPRELALQTEAELDRRNPPCPNSVIENPETGDVILDFVIWPEQSSEVEEAPFVEFNIFKYSKNPAGGIYCEQYALRAYDDIVGFLRGLRPERERLLDLMAREGLQEVDASATQTSAPTAP